MRFPGFPDGITRPLMVPEGRGTAGVLVMGESLGESEEKDGLPFRPYAEAGSILERALYRAGVGRDSLTLTNLVWYRPPRNWLDGAPWEADAIRACKPFNDALVERVRPKCILALGGMAMRELTGLSGEKCGIGMTRGFVVPSVQYKSRGPLADGEWNEAFRGYGEWPGLAQVPYGEPIPVVGSYHPSFLRRGSKERSDSGPRGKIEAAGGGTQGMALLGVLIRDILLAVQVARDGAGKFTPKTHHFGAGLEAWRGLLVLAKAHPEWPIYYDFETLDSIVASDESEFEITRRDVTQVQVCLGTGWEALVLVSDWFPELLGTFRELIQLPNTKIDWNGRKFDRPICRDMQIRTDLGQWEDCMDFWHHSQPDLARGLQFAGSFHCPEVGPWKHLSASDPHWYGLLDVDILERIHSGLRISCAQTRHPISGISLCSGYQDQVVRLAPVLDRMSARGIPVDDRKRLELDVEFTLTLERIEAECQALVPEELRNVTPRKGYVKPPAEVLRDCESCAGAGKVLEQVTRKNGRPAMKKVECSECHGGKRFVHGDVPSGWCMREFEDDTKCNCWWALPAKKRLMPSTEAELVPCAKCQNTGKIRSTFTRWARIEEFKPGSWQQVLRYIEYQRDLDVRSRAEAYVIKHPTMSSLALPWAREKSPWKVPVDHKTGRPTTAEAELRRLASKTEDTLLPKVLEHREIDNARGTYVRGWAPGADGRVHPNFGFKPATPQLSCVAPWTQLNVLGRGFPRIDEIEIGDSVWTHQRRWQKVTHIWRKGIAPMVEIKFCNGQVLTCTTDHKLLVYYHECLQAMGYTRTHPASVGSISLVGDADSRSDVEGFWDGASYTGRDPAHAYPASGVCRAQGHTLFPVEDRGEESGIWKNAAELHRDCGRWLRISDLLEARQATVCASADNGRSVGPEDPAAQMGRASYRREPEEQRSGQSGAGYQNWASDYSLPSSEGFHQVEIAEINPVGSHEVWDITVATDGSYGAEGVFSHNSDSPNAQNFITHGELAHRMKQMIVARDGYRMVKFDWKSFFIITGGFEAQDEPFVRIGRVDMHSFVTLVGLLKLERPEVAFDWSPAELKERLGWWRKQDKLYTEYARGGFPSGMTFGQIRDYIAKRVIFAWQNGQGPRSLWYLWQETFRDVAEAAKCQAELKLLFPKTPEWQTAVRMKADQDHQLITRFGHVRRFWDVYHRRPVADNYQPRGEERVWTHKSGQRWLLVPGDDHEAVTAYLPNANAYGIKRHTLVQIGERGWDSQYGLLADVHDALYFECRYDRVDSLLQDVKPLMEAKCQSLTDPVTAPNGLWCEVEAEIGTDWDHWEKLRTPTPSTLALG